ncbi:bifunctional glycosyltransferase/CDP-glycerol:glycerophosphate glycerophosphotransferase [Actinoplanes rectilineatus]|uniref:bifunctional glycosyltransferase/CDP-glycerol:glycerophosphate glycerophosphotransferase n=1 Tax=Actinoplanes rectilineatus TaxID=113571 RepID=UPI0005F27CC1|nr:bifunctional glycosyltransferase family 2 protein/CDP-glycerol:glycerophosphate glycerophosphotransferase [Actinoplanes rectilineatus]
MDSVLSVVVPIYNVAAYLDECLDSIAAQYYSNLEVIMVDDGSTDESGEIAARFADRDSRFKLVTKENAGLGAARNTGVEHATGEFLMFVDSDDVVPPAAVELLIASISETGSDFASGNVMRLNSKGVHQSALHRAAFATTVLRTHVSKQSNLMDDRTAWNKVFRRSFWDQHKLAFPEGVLYEDTPVTVPAHVLAKSVDVLDVPVYYWREREGQSKSITQRRDEVRGFIDRLAGVEQVSRFLAKRKQHKIKRIYDASALAGDLMIFMRELPKVDDEYRKIFLDGCNRFLDTVDPRVFDELTAAQRVLWRLVANRMMPELLEMIPTVRSRHRIVRKGLRRYHKLMFLEERLPNVPRTLFLAGTPRPRTRLHDAQWRENKLVLRGHAFIPGQAAAHAWTTTRLLWLRDAEGRRTKRQPLSNQKCLDASAVHGSQTISYDWSGFEAEIDVQALRGDDGKWHDGIWTVVVGVLGLGQKSKGPLTVGEHANPVRLTSMYVDKDVRITPVVTNGKFQLHVEHVGARITGGSLEGDAIEIRGEVTGANRKPATARLSRTSGIVWHSYPVEIQGDKFAFRVPVADLQEPGVETAQLLPGEPGERWDVELSAGDDHSAPIRLALHDYFTFPPQYLDHRTVTLVSDRKGHPVLTALPSMPVITGVTAAGGGFRLSGTLPPQGDWSEFQLVVRYSNARETRYFPVVVDGDTWQLDLDPLQVPSFGWNIRLRVGTWDLYHRVGEDGPVAPLPLAAAAMENLPLSHPTDQQRVTLEWYYPDQRALVRVRTALTDEERGKANGYRSRTEFYPRMRKAPLRDVVLYNSFTGRQYSDSPRAVHEELVRRDLPLGHLWVVTDGQAAIPDSGRAVGLWRREWYEALATSRYIVTNQHLPGWFERRPGQVVIQTWHGTPLKRIGFDIEDLHFADKQYFEKLENESKNWSHLVSPNTFSTPILRRAFRFPNEILEVGYPRNDVLFLEGEKRDAMVADVRRRIGLPDGKKVVLYAPTWRDDEYYRGGSYKMTMMLDLDDARERLGDDHVLLVRRHPNVVDPIRGAGNGFVYDVSTYPDMADLLAVTDVLITDYSSVMFDFAATGRPMLFFTYDLENYRDNLRGFYFDFESEAPGPLLSTSDEVVQAIRDADQVRGRYATQYKAFAERSSDLDDGHAASRLVDAMLDAGRKIS